MKSLTSVLFVYLLSIPLITHASSRADGHAPIGVMGDHLHKKGELMLSYRYSYMDMDGNRIGTNSVSPQQIVSTVPNQFFGTPGQPPTLRVVPTSMRMEMHMFGAMYAPTDNITLMVMGMYSKREMDHVTFQGPTGTTVLGNFTTRSSGFGDTKVAGLIRLHDDGKHKIHLNAGISIPTGSINEEDQVLTPTGATATVRLPYPMQLGSDTWDLEPGITYRGFSSDWGWGAQAKASIRLGENSEDYALGDRYEATAWFSYLFSNSVSTSLRIKGTTQDRIDGRDTRIVGPVQTAQTDFQGGDRIDLLAGVNFLVTEGVFKGHRFALEAGAPIYQDLNGPQLETDLLITGGWQKVF